MRRKSVGGGTAGTGGCEHDPRDAVMEAADLGRLNEAQAKALLDLASRSSLLGFEGSRTVTVIVTEIAREVSQDKRARLALELKDRLQGDGLVKDLVTDLSEAFDLG